MNTTTNKPKVGDTVYLPSHKTIVTIGTLYIDATDRIKDTVGDIWLIVSATTSNSKKAVKQQAQWVAVL